jgi:glutathione S-transferase
MASTAQKSFTLYYRENCHLCESMRLALVKLQKKVSFSWTEIDIDRDTELIFQFDTLVPVLQLDGKEVCHYFIDEKAILELISA